MIASTKQTPDIWFDPLGGRSCRISGVFILFVSRCAVGVGPRWRVQQDAWERRAGEPVPPKSSCWFCPFHLSEQWVELRAKHPALFEHALELSTPDMPIAHIYEFTFYLASSGRYNLSSGTVTIG